MIFQSYETDPFCICDKKKKDALKGKKKKIGFHRKTWEDLHNARIRRRNINWNQFIHVGIDIVSV